MSEPRTVNDEAQRWVEFIRDLEEPTQAERRGAEIMAALLADSNGCNRP